MSPVRSPRPAGVPTASPVGTPAGRDIATDLSPLDKPTENAAAKAYAAVHDHTRRDLTSNQDTLLDPAELYLEPTGEALIFRVESQGFARWGVLTADLDKADPPVMVKLNLRNETAAALERMRRNLPGYWETAGHG